MNSVDFEHFADYALYAFETSGLGDVVYLNSATLRREVENNFLSVGQLSGLAFFKVGVGTDESLALHFKP